jgi:hypothetical protein
METLAPIVRFHLQKDFIADLTLKIQVVDSMLNTIHNYVVSVTNLKLISNRSKSINFDLTNIY